MVVGRTGNDAETLLLQSLTEDLGIFDDLFLVFDEIILHRLIETDSLAGDHMAQRTALNAGEYRPV